uniref:Fucosyltransferase C-terminal domain-containing protein n=1 Tax=viral metagenome TaxID=1070528 RepID=A0A6C0HTQ8_9ZZZZ
MKVFTYGFWDDFIEKSHSDFFLVLFSKVFGEECILGTPEESDILLECTFSSESYLKYKNWKYTFFYSGESKKNIESGSTIERLDTLKMYDCILQGEDNNNNIINLPFYTYYIYRSNFIEKIENPSKITEIPPKNICVIISNPNGIERNYFCDKLEKHFEIDYAGSYKNNVPRVIDMYDTEKFQEFVSQYKFIVSMENTKEYNYITEKIVNGFLSGNIPVYWGSDNVSKNFNIDRFINVENMNDDTIDNVICRMKELMDDEEEYLKMVNNNIFPNENNKLTRTIEDVSEDIRQLIFKLPE